LSLLIAHGNLHASHKYHVKCHFGKFEMKRTYWMQIR
jgi:hypothetical protein